MASQLAGVSEHQILEAHQYQFDGTHPNRNECTLCSMTMLLELGTGALGQVVDFKAAALGRAMDRIPFRHLRFPAWFPGPGGATHPRAAEMGLRSAIRRLRNAGIAYHWWPVRLSHQTPGDLIAALEDGHPTLIYGVGSTGIPHVVVPVAHENETWRVLDPGFPPEHQPMQWSQGQLMSWWVNYWIWYPRGTMVSLVPAKQGDKS